MISRRCREELRQEREQGFKRYEKQRRRNLLAEPGPHPFIIVLDHLKASFNVAKIFRSAQAFGAHEVHLINIGPFDPAPAKGAFKAVPARFHDSFDSCYSELLGRGYTLYTLEPGSCEPLPGARLAEKSAFVLGHEERGLSFEREDYPELRSLTIPQFGPVQSLNVSVAASIVMYEYVRLHGKAAEPAPARDSA
jgi:tRNA G18 (ribose-2'-O)-methylase SpoU